MKTDFSKPPIRVYTPAGIGDALWCLMWVWSNTDRPIDLYTFRRPGNDTQFLRSLAPIRKIEMFDGTYEDFKEQAAKRRNQHYLLSQSFNDYNEVFLEVNSWMESGRRLEDYLPNMKFNWTLPWKPNKQAKEDVAKIVTGPTIAIYTSGMPLNRDAAGYNREILYDYWRCEDWHTLISSIKDTFPKTKLIWLGAEKDADFYLWLRQKGHSDLIPFIDRPGDYVMELLRRVNCFISFQSGLSVLSVMEMLPTYMLYFKYVHAVAREFCPPALTNDPSIYRSLLFDDWAPANMIRWMKKHLPQETWLDAHK